MTSVDFVLPSSQKIKNKKSDPQIIASATYHGLLSVLLPVGLSACSPCLTTCPTHTPPFPSSSSFLSKRMPKPTLHSDFRVLGAWWWKAGVSVPVKGCAPAVESGRPKECWKLNCFFVALNHFCTSNRCYFDGIQVRGRATRNTGGWF